MTFSTLGTMASYVPKQGVTGTVDLSTATVVKGAGMDLVASASLSGSSVLVTGCFSATYDNYQIVLQATNSAANDVQMRLLNGSTPNTAANYSIHLLRGGVGGTVVSAASASNTSYPVTTDGQSTIVTGFSTLYSPFLAVPTRQIVVAAAGAVQVTTQGQVHTASTSFDGMQFYPIAGTFTSGTVKIYGLRN